MHPAASLALIVDDDPFILLEATDLLEEAGFKTLQAIDVNTATGVLERQWMNIQVLFTDVHMPGNRDGFSLAREVARRWPDIQIVVASGQANPGPADMPDGATFIAKPFSAYVVRGRLRELLPTENQPPPLRG